MSKYERDGAIIRIEGREIPLKHCTYHQSTCHQTGAGGLDVDRLIERANWCLEHRADYDKVVAEHAAMAKAIREHRDGHNVYGHCPFGRGHDMPRCGREHQALLDALPAEPEPEFDEAAQHGRDAAAGLAVQCRELAKEASRVAQLHETFAEGGD